MEHMTTRNRRGGLNSGLSALGKEMRFVWFGWSGISIPEEDVKDVRETLKKEYNAIPVFLDQNLADKHYSGFQVRIPLPLAGVPRLPPPL